LKPPVLKNPAWGTSWSYGSWF